MSTLEFPELKQGKTFKTDKVSKKVLVGVTSIVGLYLLV